MRVKELIYMLGLLDPEAWVTVSVHQDDIQRLAADRGRQYEPVIVEVDGDVRIGLGEGE